MYERGGIENRGPKKVFAAVGMNGLAYGIGCFFLVKASSIKQIRLVNDNKEKYTEEHRRTLKMGVS